MINELFGAKSAEFVDPIVDADEVFWSEITLGACFLIVTFWVVDDLLWLNASRLSEDRDFCLIAASEEGGRVLACCFSRAVTLTDDRLLWLLLCYKRWKFGFRQKKVNMKTMTSVHILIPGWVTGWITRTLATITKGRIGAYWIVEWFERFHILFRFSLLYSVAEHNGERETIFALSIMGGRIERERVSASMTQSTDWQD